tara:strand:- start:803 stop:1009 length:207 start_codon:yes stop_codon:yes gene_type:complete
MFITKEYDFHDAICKFLNVAVDDVLIDKVLTISNHDDRNMVETSRGLFYCESFEDLDANVYMKVARVI